MKDGLVKYESLLKTIQLDEAKQKEFDSFVSELSASFESLSAEKPTVDVAELEQSFIEKGEEILKKAREDWEVVAEEAFKNRTTEIKEEMASEMAVAIEKLQEELKDQVRAEFYESEEYQAFEKVKEAVAPFVEGLDQKVVDELNKVKQEKDELSKVVGETLLKESIDELVSDLPEKKAKIIRKFLEACKTQEEVYAEFERVVKILQEETDGDDTSGSEPEPENDDSADDELNSLLADDDGGGDGDDDVSTESQDQPPVDEGKSKVSFLEASDLATKISQSLNKNKKK